MAATMAVAPAAAQAAVAVPGESLTLSSANVGAVFNQTSAADGKALNIWSNGSGSRQVTQADASGRLLVRARGEQCSGAPQMAVEVDGRRLMTTYVSATSYTDYVADAKIAAGAHTVKVSFLNDYKSSCDRNLIVDTVTLQAPIAGDPPAPAASTGFEAEAMTLPAQAGVVVADASASAGNSLDVWGPTAATRTHTLSAGKLVVRSKGTQCGGAPRMRVRVDGAEVLSTEVTASTWTDYTATVPTAAGSRNVSVAFTNDLYNSTCDRNLLLDKVSVTGSAVPAPTPAPSPAPTPPPTPAPSPTPTPPSPAGSVLFNGDLSSGNLSAWFTQQCAPDRTRVLRDPLGVDRNVMQMTVRNSDVAPCTPTENPRAQALSPNVVKENSDTWFGYSILVPNDFPTTTASGDNWVSLASIYGAPYNGAGPQTMYLNSSSGVNQFYFRRNASYGYDTPWSMPLVRGRWVDFVIHSKMSRDPAVGFREQFVNSGSGWNQVLQNGQLRLKMKTLDASNDGGPNFAKVSLYYRKGIMNSASLYFASAKVGTSFDAVAPRSY